MKTAFKFTDGSLKKLPANVSKDTDYTATNADGLICRVCPPRKGHSPASRRKFYYRRTLWIDGKKKRPLIKLGDHSEKLAVIRAELRRQERLDEVNANATTQHLVRKSSSSSKYTIRELMDDFVDHKTKTSRSGTISNIESKARLMLSIEDINILEFTYEDSDRWLNFLRSRGTTDNYIAQCYNLLKEAFEYAREFTNNFPRGRINPLDKKLIREFTQRESIYEYSEFVRLWHFKPCLKSGMSDTGYTWEQRSTEQQRCIRLLMLTGARSCEITKAQWDEFIPHFNDKTGITRSVLEITKSRTKKHKPFVVSLPPAALKILEEQYRDYPPKASSSRIFPSIGKQHIYDSIKKRGKFENSIHDIRRTAATCWGKIGVPEEIIKKLLSHGKKTSLDAYNKYENFHEKQVVIDTYAQLLVDAIARFDETNTTIKLGANNSMEGNIYESQQPTPNTPAFNVSSMFSAGPVQTHSLPAYP